MLWSEASEAYPENWHVGCAVCGGLDFIHEMEVARQTQEADEVIDGLAPELSRLLGITERGDREIFSLSQPLATEL